MARLLRHARRALSTGGAERAVVSGVEVAKGGSTVEVQWSDGHLSEFHAMWLQDHCSSRTHSGTGQRAFNACQVSPSTRAAACSVGEGGAKIGVVWADADENAPREAEYDAAWLRRNCFREQRGARSARRERDASQLWTEQLSAMPGSHAGGGLLERRTRGSGTIPAIHFASLIPPTVDGSEHALTRARGALDLTSAIAEVGLCIVQDAPLVPSTVLSVAECIATPQPTLYPLVFDVRSEKNPVNIAYTPLELRPHMDLLYYESPPGIQLLHCLRFDESVAGGHSTFVHAHRVAEELRRRDPDAFATLARVPATFQKDHMERENAAQMFYRVRLTGAALRAA
jgi:gamma-butyrobetaine dioxygenase